MRQRRDVDDLRHLDTGAVANIEEARLQSVKVEIGHKLSWLPTENLYFYQTVYEWTEGVHAPIAYPLGIDLTSVAPDGQYPVSYTHLDVYKRQI